MAEPVDTLAFNRAHWDEVAALHRQSYDTAGLVADPGRLATGVQQDVPLLEPWLPGGSVAGLEMMHLQCHIGSDTLSWARLGARMTGLDMSGESLRIARELADQAGVEVEYVESSINDAATALAGRSFDVVYTSIGVLAWLDDLTAWANLIAGLLRPGGIFFIREGHPMVLAMDGEAPPGELRISWPYFNVGPIAEDSSGDYSSAVPVANGRTFQWAHGLGEILGCLLKAGLTILDFQEHKTMPWKQLPWLEPQPLREYALPEPLRDFCPLEFTLVARR